MLRSTIALLSILLLTPSTSAIELDYYKILNHLDNYGNLDLRNKPYTSLPDGLVVKGNLNIAKTPIKNDAAKS